MGLPVTLDTAVVQKLCISKESCSKETCYISQLIEALNSKYRKLYVMKTAIKKSFFMLAKLKKL